MLVVHVHIKVDPDHIEAFIDATRENAEKSIQEPGIARFDLVQSSEDPTSFILMEAYLTAEDQLNHKETPHFVNWVDTVERMMGGPRRAVKYTLLT